MRWGEREAEPPGRQVPVDRHVWRAEDVERRISRAGAEIEVPDDQVRPSPGDPQAGDKALFDVERQRRVRAIDGILAAFLAFIGLSVRLAAAAGGTAGKTEAFLPVIRLLQFFRREAVLCGFRCHGGAPHRDQKMWTSSKPVWNTMISPA